VVQGVFWSRGLIARHRGLYLRRVGVSAYLAAGLYVHAEKPLDQIFIFKREETLAAFHTDNLPFVPFTRTNILSHGQTSFHALHTDKLSGNGLQTWCLYLLRVGASTDGRSGEHHRKPLPIYNILKKHPSFTFRLAPTQSPEHDFRFAAARIPSSFIIESDANATHP
jgi:hypothetical protein